MASPSSSTYPVIQPGASLIIAYQLQNAPVLLVGGGEVAAGRLFALLNAGALVTLVSPASGLSPETRFRIFEDGDTRARINYMDRVYAGEQDLEGMKMVLTAIDEAGLSHEIAAACRRRCIPVNVADVPPSCDFYFGSIVRRGPLQIMVSTQGKGPRIANRIRRAIEDVLPPEVGAALENVGVLRQELRKEAPGGGAVIQKRMSWMVDVCDKWSLAELATMDETARQRVLSGWSEGKAYSWSEVQDGWRGWLGRWVGKPRCPVKQSPDGKASRCPFILTSSGFLVGLAAAGALVASRTYMLQRRP